MATSTSDTDTRTALEQNAELLAKAYAAAYLALPPGLGAHDPRLAHYAAVRAMELAAESRVG